VTARRALALLCSLTPLALAGTACSDDAGGADEQTLTVFAAASLTEAFTTLEEAYEKDHEGVDVVLSFGSSTTLAEQVTEGAPADVLATADEVSMGIVVDADLTDGDPVPLASNTLTVVTPPGNPGDVTAVQDLGSVAYVVCAEEVPCGAAAADVLRNAKVTRPPASFEADVKAVLAKVTLGEVDAGLVYVTDAVAAGDDVDRIDIPAELNVVNPYYVAAVADSDHQDLADDWIALVTSQAGLRVLADAGFGPP
jgi:molybdate transport system substrate-binding protein